MQNRPSGRNRTYNQAFRKPGVTTQFGKASMLLLLSCATIKAEWLGFLPVTFYAGFKSAVWRLERSRSAGKLQVDSFKPR
jgi:hypothetical protein